MVVARFSCRANLCFAQMFDGKQLEAFLALSYGDIYSGIVDYERNREKRPLKTILIPFKRPAARYIQRVSGPSSENSMDFIGTPIRP